MPTSLPQEEPAKTTMISVVRIQIFSITSPDSSGYAVHKHSQVQNIIFQVYTHIYRFS